MSKLLVYGIDIEATGLKADFGQLLTVGLQQIDVENPGNHAYPPVMFAIQDYVKTPTCKYRHPVENGRLPVDDDTPLLQDVWNTLSQADMWIGWYSKGYDIKFLNSRGVFQGLPPLPPVPHVDLYFTAKSNFAISSNRLASWEEFLKLTDHKTPLLRQVWREAAAGVPAALKYVTTHCAADVVLLDSVYARLRPFIRMHPRVAGVDLAACRFCGSYAVSEIKDQLSALTKGKRVRVQCQRCRAWDTRTKTA